MSNQTEQAGPAGLIERIMSDAGEQVQKIKSDVERSLADRRASLEKRLREIQEQADARIEAERKRLESHADAQIALVEGRARLRSEDRIYREAFSGVEDAIRGLRSDDAYPAMLSRWIVEAATGLGAREALVSAPPEDTKYLEQAMEIARGELQSADGDVELSLDESIEVSGQGVVVHDATGRRSFSNLVSDRLRRFGADVRQIVYHRVIEDQS